jgi:hypothetical protein
VQVSSQLLPSLLSDELRNLFLQWALATLLLVNVAKTYKEPIEMRSIRFAQDKLHKSSICSNADRFIKIINHVYPGSDFSSLLLQIFNFVANKIISRPTSFIKFNKIIFFFSFQFYICGSMTNARAYRYFYFYFYFGGSRECFC